MTERQPSPRERGRSKAVRMAEVERAYPNEWILLEITRDARDYRRIAGRLLAHGPVRSALDEPHQRFGAAHPQARVLQIFTGDIAPEHVVVIL